MTIEEEIELWKEVAEVIGKFPKYRQYKGLCWAIAEVTNRRFPMIDLMEERIEGYETPEYGMEGSPRNQFNTQHWWPVNKEGDKERLRVIEEIITKLRSQL